MPIIMYVWCCSNINAPYEHNWFKTLSRALALQFVADNIIPYSCVIRHPLLISAASLLGAALLLTPGYSSLAILQSCMIN